MASSAVVFFIAFSVTSSFVNGDSAIQNCVGVSNQNRSLALSIHSKRNKIGNWVTTFSAWKDSSSPTEDIILDVKHNVVECDGKYVVHIGGVVNDTKSGVGSDRLFFHPKCGKNAGISHDGLSARKLNLDDAVNGVLLTNRPLNRNELFEVRLDKKHTKFDRCFAMGITSILPASLDIPDRMYMLKSGNWMYYQNSFYVNGADSLPIYGINLNEMKVGDRVGVLVNNFDTLHFFVNGVDQGPAASNIPSTVYGVFELYYNAAEATIVDASSTVSK